MIASVFETEGIEPPVIKVTLQVNNLDPKEGEESRDLDCKILEIQTGSRNMSYIRDLAVN